MCGGVLYLAWKEFRFCSKTASIIDGSRGFLRHYGLLSTNARLLDFIRFYICICGLLRQKHIETKIAKKAYSFKCVTILNKFNCTNKSRGFVTDLTLVLSMQYWVCKMHKRMSLHFPLRIFGHNLFGKSNMYVAYDLWYGIVKEYLINVQW